MTGSTALVSRIIEVMLTAEHPLPRLVVDLGRRQETVHDPSHVGQCVHPAAGTGDHRGHAVAEPRVYTVDNHPAWLQPDG
jgi:hypothetical protein